MWGGGSECVSSKCLLRLDALGHASAGRGEPFYAGGFPESESIYFYFDSVIILFSAVSA